MKLQKTAIVIAMTSAMFAGGCAAEPSCSDSSVVDFVKTQKIKLVYGSENGWARLAIAKEVCGQQNILTEECNTQVAEIVKTREAGATANLTEIRVHSKDEQTGAVACQATVDIDYPDTIGGAKDYSGATVYTVETTSEGESFVSIYE